MPTMRKPLRHVRLTLSAAIGSGGEKVVEGWTSEEGSAGIRLHDKENLMGRQQWFPGHLIESVEEITDEN